MEKEEQFNTCAAFMTRAYLQSGTWRQYFPNSYHTGNAAVDLHHTLGIDVAVVGLSIGAKPCALAASCLVTCEARFTLSTAERALERTVHRLKQWKGFLLLRWKKKLSTVVLLWCCGTLSWECSPHSQVDPSTRLYPHTPGKSKRMWDSNNPTLYVLSVCFYNYVCHVCNVYISLCWLFY